MTYYSNSVEITYVLSQDVAEWQTVQRAFEEGFLGPDRTHVPIESPIAERAYMVALEAHAEVRKGDYVQVKFRLTPEGEASYELVKRAQAESEA